MAKRSSTGRKRTATKLDEVQVKPLQASAEKVNIRNILYAKVNIVGQVTGKKYKFSESGSPGCIQPVDAEDVPSLLAKNRKRKTCCGDAAMKIIFEIA